MVKATLSEPLIVDGEIVADKGSVLYGRGNSSEERLYVSFSKLIKKDKTEMKIKAQAFDSKDRILGLKGSKVGDYAFTTLEPNLGAYFGYVLADVPGLIEGASDGKGLGHKFLRHITRTQTLVHLVAADNEDVAEVYSTIRNELGKYDKTLLKKDEVVVLSKVDLISDTDLKKKVKDLKKASGKDPVTLSLFDDQSVKEFGDLLATVLGKK
jgi:GTPase involved in cell partitioning and DNA repair